MTRPHGSLWVTGGRQRRDAAANDEWHAFDLAVALELSEPDGGVLQRIEHESPAEARPSDRPCIVFKAGSVDGSEMLLCTQTEILAYDISANSAGTSNYISLPRFNDVHHVSRSPWGTLLVANTGLDCALEMTEAGDVLRYWSALGEDPWQRFSPTIDYRKVPTTKPHHAHPNFVFTLGEDVWCTRLNQRDAISLTSGHAERIPIDVQAPHDGVRSGDTLYFTTVDGHIVRADTDSRSVTDVIDLNEIDDGEAALGWCRGILPVGNESVWVGFTRLRPTRFRQNVSWVKRGFKRIGTYNQRPTRISRFDLSTRQKTAEIVLEDHGMNAVFSILRSSDSPGQPSYRAGSPTALR